MIEEEKEVTRSVRNKQDLLDQNIKENTLTRFGVNKPHTVLVCMLIIIMLGFFAFSTLKTELLPNMNIPYVVVVAGFDADATAQNVYSDVDLTQAEGSKYIYNQDKELQSADVEKYTSDVTSIIRRISGVKVVTSNSGIFPGRYDLDPSDAGVYAVDLDYGICYMIVELNSDVDAHLTELTIGKAIASVASAKYFFTAPETMRIDPNAMPVYTFSATVEAPYNDNWYETRMLPALNGASGVAEVTSTLNNALLGDESYFNGTLAYTFSIQKTSDAETTKAVANVKKVLEELRDETNGAFSYHATSDSAEEINNSIGSVLGNLVTGGLLAIIILFLFLRNIKLTLAVAISIPLSVIGTFVLMYFMGIGLNLVSMSGLALVVGLLVDNSVIVLENCFRLRQKGFSTKDCALKGASQMFGAIVAATLTTICVFFPMFFVEGLIMQVFMDLVYVMIFALFASLIVAIMFLPAIISSFNIAVVDKSKRKDNRYTRTVDKTMGVMSRAYNSSLSWTIKNKWKTLGAALVMFVLSIILVSSNGFELMAGGDSGQFTTTIAINSQYSGNTNEDAHKLIRPNTVGATDEERMSELHRIVSQTLRGDLKDIALVYDSGSAQGGGLAAIMSSGANIGINVTMKSKKKMSTSEASKAVQAAVEQFLMDEDGEFAGFASKVSSSSGQMSMASDTVDLTLAITQDSGEITSETISRLDAAIGVVMTELSKIESIHAIDNTFNPAIIQRSNGRIIATISCLPKEGIVISKIQSEVDSVVKKLLNENKDSNLDGKGDFDGITKLTDGFEEQFNDTFTQMGMAIMIGLVLVYLVMVAMFQSFRTPFIIMITVPLAFTGGFLLLWICGLPISLVALIGFLILMGVITNNGIVLIDYVNKAREDGLSVDEALVSSANTRIRPILMTAISTVLAMIPMALAGGTSGAMMAPLAIVSIGGLLYATAMTSLVVPAFYKIFNKDKVAVAGVGAELEPKMVELPKEEILEAKPKANTKKAKEEEVDAMPNE